MLIDTKLRFPFAHRRLGASVATLAGLLTLALLAPAPAGAGLAFDCYEGCADSLVASNCQEGVDWTTSCTGLGTCPDAGSDVTVLSIHGGRIERHTSAISADLAGTFGWNLYDFNGDLTTAACQAYATDPTVGDNYEVLHITSTRFDHTEARNLVQAHPHAVSIHGCGASCSDETICVGGRDTAQINSLVDYIDDYRHLLPYTVHGSTVPASGTPFCAAAIDGDHVDNIVNDTSTGEGLQLEMSLDVRSALASGGIQDDLLRGLVYGGVAQAMGEHPLPLATHTSTQTYTWGGKTYERYFLRVENRTEYPQELFDPAPTLPPCGSNTNASRTWVRIYDAADDSYVYGYCALGSPANMTGLWFAREQGTAPAAVYLVLHDRATGRDYRSNRIPIPSAP